jgi:hypothetical protein
MTTGFALDQLALVDAQDEPLAFFFSQKELYANIKDQTGVRAYRTDGNNPDPIFMPTEISAITGAGVAVPVVVRGDDKRDVARILVATRLLSTALAGGANSLIGKKVKVKNLNGGGFREFTIKKAGISRKAIFTG